MKREENKTEKKGERKDPEISDQAVYLAKIKCLKTQIKLHLFL